VNFAAITLYVASQRVFIVVVAYFVMTQSGNFWVHLRTYRAKVFVNFYVLFRFSRRVLRVPSTAGWRVLRLKIEDKASRNGG
jgi:hypothetical protein